MTHTELVSVLGRVLEKRLAPLETLNRANVLLTDIGWNDDLVQKAEEARRHSFGSGVFLAVIIFFLKCRGKLLDFLVEVIVEEEETGE